MVNSLLEYEQRSKVQEVVVKSKLVIKRFLVAVTWEEIYFQFTLG